jgi:inosine-uridine nucleoside N-ribohydrolase
VVLAGGIWLGCGQLPSDLDVLACRRDNGCLMPIPVLIDCDPGYDDVIAIMLALASPEVEVLGITTVEGNQPVAEATENALRVVEFLARKTSVAAGANRPLVREFPFRRTPSTADADVRRDLPGLPPATGRAVDEHAIDLLARVLLTADEPVTLVPLGPLTNVALLLARYPDAAERIRRIVLMGGAIGEGNATTAAEFNIYVDPESAQRVFSSGIDLTMVGLDVTYRAIVSPAELEELRGLGRAGGVVAAILDRFPPYRRYSWFPEGYPVHDAVAVAELVCPGLLTTEHLNVVVDCSSELSRGRTVVDRHGRSGREPNVHVAVDVDTAAFVRVLIERLRPLG